MSYTINKNILLVEDHPLFREMLVQLINSEPGLTVCGETDNIRDAMTRIKQNLPDAALVDISLQEASGLELIKYLKAKGIRLPVLVLSMHSEKLYAERVIRAGAMGYISKLESPFEVLKALKKVLNGEVYVSKLINGEILERLMQTGNTVLPPGIDDLSDREIEVFQLVGRGLNSREIGELLNLGFSTVDSYKARIKGKLGIKNAAELARRAAQWAVDNNL